MAKENNKETYTKQEVFLMLSDVAESLTYTKDPEVLIGNALDKIKEIAGKL
jgi:hypothetical protein